MALNQMPISSVYKDTNTKHLTIKRSTSSVAKFPLYWANKPCCDHDPIRLKFRTETCWRCVASTEEENVVVVSECEHDVFVYEMDTGVLLHQMHLKHHITALSFTQDYKHVWIGDTEGKHIIWYTFL